VTRLRTIGESLTDSLYGQTNLYFSQTSGAHKPLCQTVQGDTFVGGKAVEA
jgi:hypothetical protein